MISISQKGKIERMINNDRIKYFLHWLYRWISQIWDPIYTLNGIHGLFWYFGDMKRYSGLSEAEDIKLINTWPQLHDRTKTSTCDPHYYYVNGWAARRILSVKPDMHIDIASQIIFSNLLGSVLPVVYVDYRLLYNHLNGLHNICADAISLPFASGELASVSCLHVAEHIGLGRYGEGLNPKGTIFVIKELIRILSRGGNIFFALPVGKPRLQFNAHRIFSVYQVMEFFSNLELIEFSGVDDDGNFRENTPLSTFDESIYACGFFWFRKRFFYSE